MQTILRDGIAIRIPPDVTAAGGEAVAQYVAAVPAACFPPVPSEFRGTDPASARAMAPALEAYLEELRATGTLAAFQATADAFYATQLEAYEARVQAERDARAAERTSATPATPALALLERARAAARQTAAALGAAAGDPTPAPAPIPVVDADAGEED